MNARHRHIPSRITPSLFALSMCIALAISGAGDSSYAAKSGCTGERPAPGNYFGSFSGGFTGSGPAGQLDATYSGDFRATVDDSGTMTVKPNGRLKLSLDIKSPRFPASTAAEASGSFTSAEKDKQSGESVVEVALNATSETRAIKYMDSRMLDRQTSITFAAKPSGDCASATGGLGGDTLKGVRQEFSRPPLSFAMVDGGGRFSIEHESAKEIRSAMKDAEEGVRNIPGERLDELEAGFSTVNDAMDQRIQKGVQSGQDFWSRPGTRSCLRADALDELTGRVQERIKTILKQLRPLTKAKRPVSSVQSDLQLFNDLAPEARLADQMLGLCGQSDPEVLDSMKKAARSILDRLLIEANAQNSTKALLKAFKFAFDNNMLLGNTESELVDAAMSLERKSLNRLVEAGKKGASSSELKTLTEEAKAAERESSQVRKATDEPSKVQSYCAKGGGRCG